MTVPLNALLCQHGTLFTDQTSVSVHWKCCPFRPLCFQSSSITCVHERLLGWRAPWQTPTALQCPAITPTLSSIRTEVPNTLNLQCLQKWLLYCLENHKELETCIQSAPPKPLLLSVGLRLTGYSCRRDGRGLEWSLVAQWPVCGFCATHSWSCTLWHISTGSQMSEAYEELVCEPRGWAGKLSVLPAPWSPVLDLKRSGAATKAGHQHGKGWQSADTGAQMGTPSVKHLTSTRERSKLHLHQRGTAPRCHARFPGSAPGSCRPAPAAATGRAGQLLVSSSLRFPAAGLLDAGVLA